MKAKLLGIVVALMTVFSSAVLANTPYEMGWELTPIMETEDFVPLVFLHEDGCVVNHNSADGGDELVERVENYAFEGEQIICTVLVVDKNGVPEKIEDVYMTVGVDQEPTPDDIEVNCDYVGPVCSTEDEPEDFNARIDEEALTCEKGDTDHNDYMNAIAGVYTCELSVEPQMVHHGEYWISVVAEDLDGQLGWAVEQQYWFLNPDIALLVTGDVNFGTVRPGTISYADALTVMNDAEMGSGVLLDMFISGTDFFDPFNSGAKCPAGNVLLLGNFGYRATGGAYHTVSGHARGAGLPYGLQGEGYYGIPYENGNENARQEIIEGDGTIKLGGVTYQAGNVLTPGAEITMVFAVGLPIPCNGDFSMGSFFLWAEAI